MIIDCDNCNKKFEVDDGLIPEKGRLLQCNFCNHKWFFKKEFINKPFLLDKDVSHETIELLDEKINPILSSDKILLDQKIKIKNDENLDVKSINRNKRKHNILSITLVFIVSFVAMIVIVDTFKYPISEIVPNIEFLLYNLYESIKDIILFLKDLI